VYYTVGYVGDDGLLHIVGRFWATSRQEAVKKTVLHKVYRIIAWPSRSQDREEEAS
jgi:DNA helicase HerA-like ATPase